MSKQQHSASLQIVENNQEIIQITQNSFQIEANHQHNFIQISKNNDTFELSLDENSLTFRIEDSEQANIDKHILKEGNINSTQFQALKNVFTGKLEKISSPIAQQQRKRKRKEIFQKYKQKSTENLVTGPDLQVNNSNLMDTFDQIFKIKSPQKGGNKESKKILNQRSTSPVSSSTVFKKKQSIQTGAVTSVQQIPVFSKRRIQQTPKETVQIDSMQLRASEQNFELPSNISEFKTVDHELNIVLESTNSFLLEGSVNKISIIESGFLPEQQISRDSCDIQALLKSQIFRNQPVNQSLPNCSSYKNISVSTVSPSILLTSPQRYSQLKEAYPSTGLSLKREKSQNFFPTKETDELLKRNLSQRKIYFVEANLQQKLIVKQIPISYDEQRIPVFLRSVRKRNSLYPNFSSKSKSYSIFLQEHKNFKDLLVEFGKALVFLDFMNEIAFEKYTFIKEKQKGLHISLNLQTFLTCGWEKQHEVKEIDQLQPRQNFIKRRYEYEKANGALKNYLYIVQFYQKSSLNLQDERAQKKYFQIRSKFWQIQKNIKMIGEDVYTLLMFDPFPSHYYQFLKVLKNDIIVDKKHAKLSQKLQYFKHLLGLYYLLKSEGDILCNSEIGCEVKLKLEKLIKKVVLI